MTTTREGNAIYPVKSGIRQAIPDKSLCKGCMHLGDHCRTAKREHKEFDGFCVVVVCPDVEVVV